MNSTDVLEEANKIILGDRRTDYGPPTESFTTIARLWSTILGTDVQPYQVALCMIQLKVVRAMNNCEHEDSWVDIAGYAALGSEVSYE